MREADEVIYQSEDVGLVEQGLFGQADVIEGQGCLAALGNYPVDRC